MHKKFLLVGSILGALAVGIGAFGAHGLKQYVQEDTLNIFETGVRYQFYHVFALLAAGMLYEKFPVKWVRYAGNCFIAGIILFSGSLYTMVAARAANMDLDQVGVITPVGGLLLIAGWLFLFWSLRSTAKTQ